jgi:RNA polymerase sigma factor (sigma-70 family)
VDEAQRKEQFRVIYEAAYPRILGYALRHCATPEDAADLVSETFLTAWRRFDELPPGDETLLWFYGVAHRLLANQRRGQRRREALSGRLAGELAKSLQAWFDQTPSDLAPLGRAWRRLRPQDRELLGLVGWEGLDNRQLGRVLGCSPTAVKVRLHRARRRFATELAKAGVEFDSAVSDAATAATPPADNSGDRRSPRHFDITAADPAMKPIVAAGHEGLGRTPARRERKELP